MANTLKISIAEERPKTSLQLSDGRMVNVGPPPIRLTREPSWAARRPGWGDARRVADRTIGSCVEPRMSEAEIAALSRRDRHALMLAVVRRRGAERDWRSLYGSSLSVDERFVAVNRWAQRREFEDLRDKLRGTREHFVLGTRGDFAEQAKRLSGAALSPTLAGSVGLADRFRLPAMGIADLAGSSSVLGLYKGRGIGQIESITKTAEQILGLGTFKSYDWMKVAESAGIKGSLAGIGAGLEVPRLSDTIATALGIGKGRAGTALIESLLGQQGIAGDMWSSKLTEITKAATIGAQFGFAGSGSAAFDALKLPWAGFDVGRFDVLRIGTELPGFAGLGQQFSRTLEGLIVVEYRRVWGQDPIWFLLGQLDPKQLPGLLRQGREQVYDAVLDALERVLSDVPVIASLREAIDSMEFLGEEQRQWLTHGLEHAERGQWTQALPPLFAGFEGGLFNSAVEARLLPATRRGKLLPAEKIIKAIDFGEALEDFAVQVVFGKGNSFRHGRPGHRSRDQVMWVVVGIVAWVDRQFATRGTDLLVDQLQRRLMPVLGRESSRPTLASTADE